MFFFCENADFSGGESEMASLSSPESRIKAAAQPGIKNQARCAGRNQESRITGGGQKHRLPPLAGGRDGSRGGSCARRQRTRKTGRRRLHHAGLPEIALRRKLRLMTDLPASDLAPSDRRTNLVRATASSPPLTHSQPSRKRQPANAIERQ